MDRMGFALNVERGKPLEQIALVRAGDFRIKVDDGGPRLVLMNLPALRRNSHLLDDLMDAFEAARVSKRGGYSKSEQAHVQANAVFNETKKNQCHE